ncbi:hypothetical protein ACWEP5_36560 [Nocardia niigatensis]
MPRRSNHQVRIEALEAHRQRQHRRICDPRSVRAAGRRARVEHGRYQLLAAGETPVLERGMLALINLNGRVRPVAVAAELDDGYRVVRLSIRIPGLRWAELTDTRAFLSRRTVAIPDSVDVPAAAALLVLGWLSDTDLALIDQIADVRDGMIADLIPDTDEAGA